MMTFKGKELKRKPEKPIAFINSIGYELGKEDIMSDKPIESLAPATPEEKENGRRFYPKQVTYYLDLTDFISSILKEKGVEYQRIKEDYIGHDGFIIIGLDNFAIGKIFIDYDMDYYIVMY